MSSKVTPKRATYGLMGVMTFTSMLLVTESLFPFPPGTSHHHYNTSAETAQAFVFPAKDGPRDNQLQ